MNQIQMGNHISGLSFNCPYTSIHKINHYSLVPSIWIVCFFLHKKTSRKKILEDLRLFLLQDYLHFKGCRHNGLYNFLNLWKISNSFCAYFCLTWFYFNSSNWLHLASLTRIPLLFYIIFHCEPFSSSRYG